MKLTMLCSLLLSFSLILEVYGANYNSRTEICCDGNVFQRNGNWNLFCCGSRSYDTAKQACCGSRLYPFPSSNRLYFCCEGTNRVSRPYDYTKQICCAGEILNAGGVGRATCCKSKSYDPSTELCCNDEVVGRTPDTDCCGGKIYNKKEQTCCQKLPETRLVPREGDKTECCGWELYDRSQNTCCDGVIKPLPEAYEDGDTVLCCMGTPFVSGKELCCQNFKKDDTGVMTPVEAQVHLKDGDFSSCCGLKLYDFKNQVCCEEDNTIRDKPENIRTPSTGGCCGARIIANTDLEICYMGSIVPRRGYAFCGNDPYNIVTEICCNGKVLKKTPEVACCSNRVTYNPTKETCCGLTNGNLSADDTKANRTSCCNADQQRAGVSI